MYTYIYIYIYNREIASGNLEIASGKREIASEKTGNRVGEIGKSRRGNREIASGKSGNRVGETREKSFFKVATRESEFFLGSDERK